MAIVSKREFAIENRAGFTPRSRQRQRRLLVTEDGQTGHPGLSVLRLVEEECEKELENAKSRATTIEIATDEKQTEKLATSTPFAPQHRQQQLQRQCQLRIGQSGHPGRPAQRLADMDKRLENATAWMPMAPAKTATERKRKLAIAAPFPAQLHTLPLQPRIRSGLIGPNGRLVQKHAESVADPELATARARTAQVPKINNKNAAGECARLILQKQRPRKILTSRQVLLIIQNGHLGRLVQNLAMVELSIELENASRVTAMII